MSVRVKLKDPTEERTFDQIYSNLSTTVQFANYWEEDHTFKEMKQIYSIPFSRIVEIIYDPVEVEND